MDWFQRLTGFPEGNYHATRARLTVEGARLKSIVNGKHWAVGELEVVSLAELRARAQSAPARAGQPVLSIVQGDVRHLHAKAEYAGALFQVASQFNALEMTSPAITPEHGVTRYENDPTQGPACAIAAGAATIYRNYFVPVDGIEGQSRDRQINGLASIGAALSSALALPERELWSMKNGYALCSGTGLKAISLHLARLSPKELDGLRAKLAVVVQRGVEITDSHRPDHLVSQAFCSALPVSYTDVPTDHWRAFASLILEAAYAATLWEAVQNSAAGGSNVVLLTLLGGGAFGNEQEWIISAMRRALREVSGFDLGVKIVCHGRPSRDLADFVRSWA